MTHKQAESILSRILSRTIEVSRLDQLRHPGTGTVCRIAVANGTIYLLKSYPLDLRPSPDSRPFWDTESRNLKCIDPAITINKPRYFGSYQNYFLEEFIAGDLFEDLLNSQKLTTEENRVLFRAAIDELVNIHSAASLIRDRRLLRRPFEPAKLLRTLDDARQQIEQDGFPAYAGRGLEHNPHWIKALGQLPVKQVEADLNTSHSYIIGHGDFKPNNLIVTPARRVAVVDWLGLGKAQPWFDLSYLLNSAPPAERPVHVAYYLEQMENRGLLSGITVSGAQRLLKSGSIYQELVRARSNSRYIGTRADPHHVNEFTAALDGLTRLVLDE